MTYQETVEYIINRPRTGTRVGLGYMRALLAALGNPENQLQFVHIAGTNGKGSATVMTASVLKEAGYKVGCAISPFVVDFRERFMIDGEMITPQALQEVAAQVIEVSRRLDQTVERGASSFELTIAIALLWFAQQKCDIVCMEVGLGGLDDITNVIQNTLVAYVMAIDYDHTERLGNTLGEIAAQKCGIFKNGCTVVSYPGQSEEAMAVIRRMAAEAGCELIVPDLDDLTVQRRAPFYYYMNYGGYETRQPFPGLHQACNATVVVEGCLALWRRGFNISDEAIMEGIRKAVLPARIEVLRDDPLVLLDGSHNAGGIQALCHTLKAEALTGLTAVVGILGDKQPRRMLEQLAPYVNRLLAVAPQNKRALSAGQLAQLGEGLYHRIEVFEELPDALEQALSNDGPVLICGSLYLASEARNYLMARIEDEDRQ